MALSYGGDEFAKYFYRGDALAQIAHGGKWWNFSYQPQPKYYKILLSPLVAKT